MKPQPITYQISFQEAQFSSPADGAPTIRNVILLGADSVDDQGKVKRRYTVKCMREAVGLFEGCRTFVNHATPDEMRAGNRDIKDLAGRFVRVRFVESEQKIRADFEGLPNDPAAQKFVSIAEHMPEVAGCSQDAFAEARMEGDIEIMESIVAVNSVDLVCKPATTANLFESIHTNPDNGVPVMEFKDITIHGLRDERADLVTQLVQEGQSSRDDELQTIINENTDLKKQVDVFQVKEAVYRRRGIVNAVLESSDLPVEAITEVFKRTLEDITGADDKELKAKAEALIEDRKAVLESVSGGVKNVTEKRGEENKGAKTTADQDADLLHS